jgi:uncharacterized protein
VTLVDANLLVYAANADAPEHERAKGWLEGRLNGAERVGISWESLVAFVRITTNPRITPHPLTSEVAWAQVEEWLSAPVAWVPLPTDRHAGVLGGLMDRHRPSGKLVPDAHLAALAIEHGLEICSADTDFARFTEIRWINPLQA